jgi:hypothetical protein
MHEISECSNLTGILPKKRRNVRQVVVDVALVKIERDLTRRKAKDEQTETPVLDKEASKARERLTKSGTSLLRLSETPLERGADLAKLRRYLSEKVRVTACWRTMLTATSESSDSPFLACTQIPKVGWFDLSGLPYKKRESGVR